MSSSDESPDEGVIEDHGEAVESDREIPGDDAPEAEKGSGEEQNAEKQVVKPKRVVRNPQIKLNEETLKGKRGLTALPSYFERVKYKGKGHEEEDLKVMLKTYEYWCHRLFPKFPFDDAVTKIEKLGSKRAVVTHIKKIRLDMITDDEPVLPELVDSDNEGSINDNLFDSITISDVPQSPPIRITDEQLEQIRQNRERAEKLRLARLEKAQERCVSSLIDSQNFSEISELTEEQLERIRENREKAARLRLERLRKIETSSQIGSSKNAFSESLSQLSSILSSEFNYQNSINVEVQCSQEENPLETTANQDDEETIAESPTTAQETNLDEQLEDLRNEKTPSGPTEAQDSNEIIDETQDL